MDGMKTVDFFAEVDGTLDVDEVIELTALVEMQLKAERAVERVEEELKDAKKNLRKVQEQLLPDAMTAAGVDELKLVSGHKIKITDFVRCHIKKEEKPKAYEYLRGIGSGDLIKNEITIPFQSGKDTEAAELMSKLQDMGFLAHQKENVHTGTLQAWVKEQLKEGRPLDKDLLGVYVGQKASIK